MTDYEHQRKSFIRDMMRLYTKLNEASGIMILETIGELNNAYDNLVKEIISEYEEQHKASAKQEK